MELSSPNQFHDYSALDSKPIDFWKLRTYKCPSFSNFKKY